MRKIFSLWIDVVDYFIRIVGLGCCKYHQLESFAQCFKAFCQMRSQIEVSLSVRMVETTLIFLARKLLKMSRATSKPFVRFSTQWISVSSRSNTRVIFLFLSSFLFFRFLAFLSIFCSTGGRILSDLKQSITVRHSDR